MIIDKELQQSIINRFEPNNNFFIKSGYAYNLLPPDPDHFWIITNGVCYSDIIFLSDLLEDFSNVIYGPSLTIDIEPVSNDSIKIRFY